MEFSASMAKATKPTNMSDIEDSDEEEPGEEIESAPPLKVGEEREINTSSGSTLKKKLLKSGRGWETPEFGDEVTVHYVGTLLDGSKFDSSRDKGEPFTFKLGSGDALDNSTKFHSIPQATSDEVQSRQHNRITQLKMYS